ncbi:MAG: hypothetical protein NWR78_03105 [Aquiluna sp.]|nr:hypothetical protein [Aquiluna sp.]
MVRQLNPSLARLWLSNTTRQYGSDARLVLDSLTEPELRVLEYLEQGIPDNQLAQLPKMARATEISTQSLLDRLAPLMSKTSSFLPLLDADGVQREFSEIIRLYLLEHKDPASALRKRLASKLYVSELNRTGLVLARGFAASGIGSIFTADQNSVSPSDTLELGYPPSELGVQRARAAKRMISPTNIELHSRVTQSYDRSEVAILIASDVIDPRLYAPWMSRDVPHIAIVYSELGVTVSHLVLPGITPCIACLELHRLQSDSSWATTAPQLAQLERDLADSSLVLFSASLALSLSLNLIDGVAPQEKPWASRLLRTSELQQLELQSANCGCRPAQ